jgi:hypothetical protein
MSARIRRNLVNQLAEAAIESVWVQWRSLGSHITAKGQARWIVDPEALVLISLALRDYERRLWDVLASWAKTGSRLLSVQRMKNLQSRYPSQTNERLAEFARIAFEEGGDHRWRKLAGAEPGPQARDQRLSSPRPRSWHAAALMVRLRLGIGVGLPADILTFLLSLRGGWASVRLIAEATDYSVYGIRRTAEKMAAAQLIESTTEKPLEYRADTKAWKPALGLVQDVPPWRFWYQTYAFVADLVWRDQERELEAPSAYLLSSRLRDLTEKHQDALRLNRIRSPEPSQFIGDEYLVAFEEIAECLARWMTRGV